MSEIESKGSDSIDFPDINQKGRVLVHTALCFVRSVNTSVRGITKSATLPHNSAHG